MFLPASGFQEFSLFFFLFLLKKLMNWQIHWKFFSLKPYIVIKQPLEYRNPIAEVCSDWYPVFLKILKGLNRKEACSCYNATFDSSQKPHVLGNASLPLETKFTLNNFVCCIWYAFESLMVGQDKTKSFIPFPSFADFPLCSFLPPNLLLQLCVWY